MLACGQEINSTNSGSTTVSVQWPSQAEYLTVYNTFSHCSFQNILHHQCPLFSQPFSWCFASHSSYNLQGMSGTSYIQTRSQLEHFHPLLRAGTTRGSAGQFMAAIFSPGGPIFIQWIVWVDHLWHGPLTAWQYLPIHDTFESGPHWCSLPHLKNGTHPSRSIIFSVLNRV